MIRCAEESPSGVQVEGVVAMLRTGGCHVGKQPQGQSNKHPFSESRAASPLPPPLPLASPRNSLTKIVLTCRLTVCNHAWFLTRSLSVPLLSFSLYFSLTLSSTTPSKPRHCPLCYFLLSAFSSSLHSRTFRQVLTKQLLDDIFRGRPPPPIFLPTFFHKHSFSGGGKLNSLPHYGLIWHA